MVIATVRRESSSDEWRRVLEAAPDALLAVDAAGKIAYANATAESLLGYGVPELVGMEVGRLVPERVLVEYRRRRSADRAERRRSLGPTFTLPVQRADGSEVLVDVTMSAFSVGDARMVIAAVRDATARHNAEQERTRSERDRIAGDLHDDVLQSIYAVGLDLQALRSDQGLSKDAAIDRAIGELHGVIADLRAYMERLLGTDQPAATDGDMLVARLRSLLHAYGSRPRWHLDLDLTGEVNGHTAEQLYLVAKELISNVARHADADDAWITVRSSPKAIELVVEDNGTGFDIDARTGTSFGLVNLQHRTEALRARVTIKSQRDAGTIVTVQVPVR